MSKVITFNIQYKNNNRITASPPPLKFPSQDLLEPPRQSHRHRSRSPHEIKTQPSLPIATSMLETPSSDRPRYLRPSDMVTTPLQLDRTGVA
ncbi:hypothetical protein TIFTF001_052264 [Ficus carica]|uniref:Uncharacterized protein n=1 Tax=Ficus carica TaxID=3494 RepID=A0AA88EIB5_FICCA|nr:hypothetical protein TIFTF001_052264 [Ficus carica]